jgi:hypothetical protein
MIDDRYVHVLDRDDGVHRREIVSVANINRNDGKVSEDLVGADAYRPAEPCAERAKYPDAKPAKPVN